MPLSRARRRRKTRLAQLILLGLVGVALSGGVFRIARESDLERVKAALELRAEWRARDMERKLVVAGNSAEALATFVAAERPLTAARFHNFARLAHKPSALDSALIWAPMVSEPDRAAFVDAARADGDASFDIRDIGPGERVVPAGLRPQYLPRLYEETFDGTPGLSGYDLLSQDERSTLVDQVRDQGVPLASSPFRLLQAPSAAWRFAVFWPVYGTGVVPDSVEGRRAAFRGVAAARFLVDRVFAGLIVDTPQIIEAMDISIRAAGSADRPIAVFDPAKQRFAISDAAAPDFAADGVTVVRDFTVFGQHWLVRSHFPAQAAEALTSSAPWSWLIFGLVTTLMLIVYTWRQTELLGEVEVLASETDDRFRRLFDANPIGMALATAHDYRFVRVNTAFATMLGHTPDELVGHVRDEFAAPGSLNMPPVETTLDQGWDAVDTHYVSKTGKIITARVRGVRLPSSASGPALILKLVEDVTEQRRLEATLRQAQKMEAIGQLTGGMAHDFNNLLGIIIGNLDLLQVSIVDRTDEGELVEEALAAALRGAELTRRLLAFARRQPLNPDRICLNEQLTEITRLLTRTLGEQIRISLDLAPDVWPVTADPVQLEACIINLATNARDAMTHGGTLRIATANRKLDAFFVATHAEANEGEYAMIEITDNGSGMPPDVLEQIFEPFFTTKGPDKGTGLGLSMVFGFLKQSKGHVTAYSEPDVGSTFRLYLPRADGAADDQAVADAEELQRGHGETVLVVEDNEPLRRVVVRQLKSLGYAVAEAEGARAALDILNNGSIALVLSDIVMPGEVDGFELANDIRLRWPGTKILLTSGFPEAKFNRRSGPASAPARLLGKPYRTDDLARAVREVLEA